MPVVINEVVTEVIPTVTATEITNSQPTAEKSLTECMEEFSVLQEREERLRYD